MIKYATDKDIIKQIEKLYIEGDEPTLEIIELCGQVGDEDCNCWGSGITEESDEVIIGHHTYLETHIGICDCITKGFSE